MDFFSHVFTQATLQTNFLHIIQLKLINQKVFVQPKLITNAKPKAKKQRYFLVNKTAFILPFICCHCRYMKMVEDCMRKLTKPVISQISVLSAICLVSAHSPRFYLLKLVQWLLFWFQLLLFVIFQCMVLLLLAWNY